MFEVSEKASEVIKQFLKEREGSQSIRVLMTEGGWKGAYLVMALDEQKENDQVFSEKGLTFLMETDLFDRAKPVRIEYVESTLGAGFKLKSELMKGSIFECDSIRDHCEMP
jgi:Fe-S cluster assembly iron-binding protein IscA